MSKPVDLHFIVHLDLNDLQDYCPEVRYDGIINHLEKLVHLESAISEERHRLLSIARELEGQILYSRKIISEERNENNS